MNIFLKIPYILKTTNKILNGTFVEIHKHLLKARRFYKAQYFFICLQFWKMGTYFEHIEEI